MLTTWLEELRLLRQLVDPRGFGPGAIEDIVDEFKRAGQAGLDKIKAVKDIAELQLYLYIDKPGILTNSLLFIASNIEPKLRALAIGFGLIQPCRYPVENVYEHAPRNLGSADFSPISRAQEHFMINNYVSEINFANNRGMVQAGRIRGESGTDLNYVGNMQLTRNNLTRARETWNDKVRSTQDYNFILEGDD